jgi:hypothetical protein
MARYPIIFSNPQLTLLEPELLTHEVPFDALRCAAEYCWWALRLLAQPLHHTMYESACMSLRLFLYSVAQGAVHSRLPEMIADLPQVDWSGPSPYQVARIFARSDGSLKITRTGPILDWTGLVGTSPHPDYGNHRQSKWVLPDIQSSNLS